MPSAPRYEPPHGLGLGTNVTPRPSDARSHVCRAPTHAPRGILLVRQGHNVEQFRIYEAIEAGAIPILSHDEGFLKDHMPPEYLASPMLILDQWEDLVGAMVALNKDPAALDQRQADMKRWYEDYMRGRAQRIEAVLEAHEDATGGFCAAYRKTHEQS